MMVFQAGRTQAINSVQGSLAGRGGCNATTRRWGVWRQPGGVCSLHRQESGYIAVWLQPVCFGISGECVAWSLPARCRSWRVSQWCITSCLLCLPLGPRLWSADPLAPFISLQINRNVKLHLGDNSPQRSYSQISARESEESKPQTNTGAI